MYLQAGILTTLSILSLAAATTPALVTDADETFTMPDLVPSTPVDMAEYSTGSSQRPTAAWGWPESDAPTLSKRAEYDHRNKRAATASLAVITEESVTFTMPNLAPGNTVNMETDSTADSQRPTGKWGWPQATTTTKHTTTTMRHGHKAHATGDVHDFNMGEERKAVANGATSVHSPVKIALQAGMVILAVGAFIGA